MKITLAQAGVIRNQLEAMTVEVPSFSVAVYISETPELAVIEEQKAKVLDSLTEITKRIEHLSELRTLISEANKTTGIDKILTEISAVKKQIYELNQIISSLSYTKSSSISLQDFMIEQTAFLKLDQTDKLRKLSIFIGGEAEEKFRETLKALKRRVTSFEQERARVNASSLVQLSDGLALYLNDINLL
jgi:hypothetical protein